MKRGKRKKKGALTEEDEDDSKTGRKKRKADDSLSPELAPQQPQLPQPAQQVQVPQRAHHHFSPTLLGGPQPHHLMGMAVSPLNGMAMGMSGWPQMHSHHPGDGLKVIVREPQSLDQPLLRKLPSMEDMFLLPTGLV